MKNFTTSWDDGHPEDLRIAEILNKHNIPAIFYIPIKNVEGRKVLSRREIMLLSKKFEIGSHTYSHMLLTQISLSNAWEEIKNGKKELEQIIGREVTKFCYPRGRYNKEVIKLVRKAGFKSARKVRLFNTTKSKKDFEHEPNLHFYHHSVFVLLAHLLKNRDIKSMIALTKTYHPNFENFIGNVKNIDSEQFEIWGHSWEVKEKRLFNLLDNFLKNAHDK